MLAPGTTTRRQSSVGGGASRRRHGCAGTARRARTPPLACQALGAAGNAAGKSVEGAGLASMERAWRGLAGKSCGQRLGTCCRAPSSGARTRQHVSIHCGTRALVHARTPRARTRMLAPKPLRPRELSTIRRFMRRWRAAPEFCTEAALVAPRTADPPAHVHAFRCVMSVLSGGAAPGVQIGRVVWTCLAMLMVSTSCSVPLTSPLGVSICQVGGCWRECRNEDGWGGIVDGPMIAA